MLSDSIGSVSLRPLRPDLGGDLAAGHLEDVLGTWIKGTNLCGRTWAQVTTVRVLVPGQGRRGYLVSVCVCVGWAGLFPYV